jgi:hypothetical protein
MARATLAFATLMGSARINPIRLASPDQTGKDFI